MYHPNLTAAVAAEHRAALLRAAEQDRIRRSVNHGHRHIKLVRPQWWTRVVTRVSAVRIAHA